MAKVCITLAQGFEEVEAISLIDVLRRGDVKVTIAAVGGRKEVVSVNRVLVTAETLIEEVNSDEYDLLLLPGGLPGAENLAGDDTVIAMIKTMHSKGKYVGALCAAPIALKEAGVLSGNYTAYPGWEEKIGKEEYTGEKFTENQNILTSKGPGTALCFGIEILKRLKGEEMANMVKNGMLADFCE